MVAAALNVGVTSVEIKEILYQSVPYVGMAKAFDFVHATNEVMSLLVIQLPCAVCLLPSLVSLTFIEIAQSLHQFHGLRMS